MIAHTLKEGSGTPLVFLHGFLGCAADWEPVCSFLPRCHCIAYDLPGHGSTIFSEEIEIDLPHFHLIGYSMGGRIAMQYAKKNPQKIKSLTLLSTHPGLQTDEEKEKRLLNDQMWAKNLLQLPIDDFLIRWYDQSLFKTFTPNFNMRKKQNVLHLAKALIHYSLAKQSYQKIQEAVVGEYDEKFRALHENPLIIAHAGHVVHLENPQAVAKLIEQRALNK
ncbi:MAG: hypothetical protein COT85_02980 [Chlamydiae bacterium CG10_big_fil_rev_8_21_14_0_10_42_34]|nr:MAG: hypothetical protein COT85_02980 [Chlamydiae bacterium CG10_big_fil_rev_8_21_14_0_10_42_34]